MDRKPAQSYKKLNVYANFAKEMFIFMNFYEVWRGLVEFELG